MRYALPTTMTALDIIGLACLFVFVLSSLTLAEVLRRKDKVSGSTSRKIVHLSVGNVILVFPFVFSSVWFALIGPVFFIPFTYFTCPGSPIKKFKLKGVEEGHTYGTVFYAIALTALVALFFYPKLQGEPINQYNIILFGSFMPLVWGDGISAVIGSKFGNDKPYTIFGGTKTLLGSWAAAFATFFAVTISCLILSQTIVVSIYIGLFTGFITAIIEAITPKGFDNLAVPAVNALALYLLFRYFSYNFGGLETSLLLSAVITGLIGGLILAILGIIFKALTWDGA
ncbi:MAG: diacylglycerol/polyprenol kinase family protein, partial [Candidatus Heimdallarchaeaceae archaeon]